jgi:tetratricopeptide (TPR) repeat protein
MDHSNVISLSVALEEIGQICGSQLSVSPLFLMVGAGVSWPVIPTVNNIIDDCKRAISGRSEATGIILDAPTDPKLAYSWYIETAFPSPVERWRYFAGLIKDKPLSKANRLLAVALAKRLFGNILLTTNFDDQIERALHVLGAEHPGAIDSPEDVYKLDGNSPFPQILYLHGKFVFQNLANSEAEIQKRTEHNDGAVPRLGIHSMFQAASELLRDRSPLVVGYSGEVDDVFLQAMKDRPKRGDRAPGYWFCYSPADVDRVLELLSFDRSIRIVIAASGVLSAETTMAALVDRLLPGPSSSATPWSLPEFQPEIDESQGQNFVAVAENVRFQELESTELTELTDHLLKCFDKLSDKDPTKVRAAEFALRVAEGLLSRDGSKFEYRQLHARTLLTSGLFSVFRERYADSLPFLERLKRDYQDEVDPRFIQRLAGASFYRAIALNNLGRGAEALAEARACLLAYSSFDQQTILSYTMMTASNLAMELARDGSEETLAEAWKWLLWIQQVYPGPGSGNCGEAYYKSALLQSELFEKKGKFSAALAALERIVKGRKELATLGQETARFAIEERSRILVRMERYSRADLELKRLGRYFGSDIEIKLREKLGRREIRTAMMIRGLGVLGGPKEEKRLKEIELLCGQAVSTELRAQLAHCFVMLIEQYFDQRRLDEALSAANDLFDSFGIKPADSALRQPVATGLSLRCKTIVAKIHDLPVVDRNELLKRLANDLTRAAEPLKAMGGPEGYFFLAYGYFLLGNLNQGANEAVAGAQLADLDNRNWFLEHNFKAENHWEREEKHEPLPAEEVAFQKWFQDLITGVKLPPKAKRRARPPRAFTYRWAFGNDPD